MLNSSCSLGYRRIDLHVIFCCMIVAVADSVTSCHHIALVPPLAVLFCAGASVVVPADDSLFLSQSHFTQCHCGQVIGPPGPGSISSVIGELWLFVGWLPSLVCMVDGL